ncbi:S-formylglutathione hydrolase [Saccharomycopsis crataegensis]|uniref:S-formylglutathione hydrolase n=1 Tax=Saccharomycopsis crataegensis TaxID=43959 RepID=A0AAV5QQQ3_9ASCO|nr:S-formylglutathione hydrolase [Saccharomycopsis crataegensis]
MTFTVKSEIYTFGGRLLKLSHQSLITNSFMDVNVYLPSQYFNSPESLVKIPVLIYLSGLTCTPQNASEKAGLFGYADKYGLALVFPDTSPKNLPIAGSKDSWDFGESAGFYLDATKEPWSKYFQMHSYILKEIPLLAKQYPKLDFTKKSIMGHSMGGLGALLFFLRNNSESHTEFQSVSCFAPICAPMSVPWGKKAFGGYLADESEWAQYDPTQLIKKYQGINTSDILIHQGTKDGFYSGDINQLQPEKLVEAVKGTRYDGKLNMNLVEGYDHSYYFIASFAGEHVLHHAKALGLV